MQRGAAVVVLERAHARLARQDLRDLRLVAGAARAQELAAAPEVAVAHEALVVLRGVEREVRLRVLAALVARRLVLQGRRAWRQLTEGFVREAHRGRARGQSLVCFWDQGRNRGTLESRFTEKALTSDYARGLGPFGDLSVVSTNSQLSLLFDTRHKALISGCRVKRGLPSCAMGSTEAGASSRRGWTGGSRPCGGPGEG